MKRRSFLLSLLAPALAFLGIGRDRIPGAMGIFADSLGISEPKLRSMVIEGQGGKLVFPNVVISATDDHLQIQSSFPIYRWTDTPTYYEPRRVAPSSRAPAAS